MLRPPAVIGCTCSRSHGRGVIGSPVPVTCAASIAIELMERRGLEVELETHLPSSTNICAMPHDARNVDITDQHGAPRTASRSPRLAPVTPERQQMAGSQLSIDARLHHGDLAARELAT